MKSPARMALLLILVQFMFVFSAYPMDKENWRGHRDGGFFKPVTVATPNWENCTHRSNNIILTVSNMGFFGAMMESYEDCETGDPAPSCVFPAGTNQDYLYAASLWVGAVVGSDTLVSVGWDPWQWTYEMWPCAESDCGMQKRSNLPTSDVFSDDAKSDLEYVAHYSDTLSHSQWTGTDWIGRYHVPLDIQIKQTSYSWGVEYAEDFILIDYEFRNVGLERMENVFIGLLVDGDVGYVPREAGSFLDDFCGFRETLPSQFVHGYLDTINLAWIADNDGDPSGGAFDPARSVRGLTGVRVMRTPGKQNKVSFNWWTSNSNPIFDWGPMMEANKRNFGHGGMGTPEGDEAKYYMMSNGEQDYNQVFAARSYTDVGWLPPSAAVATQIAQGGDTRYLMSTGPFEIDIGDTLHLTVAYIGGEDFHRSPDDYQAYMVSRYDPETFYSTLDFTDVGYNAVWASWVYDNPGFDTDGDGNSGSFWEIPDTLPNGDIVIDTFFYAGDGVPDFRASTPPPPPILRASTAFEEVTIRWNGLLTETFIDPFTRIQDFEGYNVYYGRLDREDEYALVESRDFYNYKRYELTETIVRDTNGVIIDVIEEWVPADKEPITLLVLQEMYGEEFDPEEYRYDPYSYQGFDFDGNTFSFENIGWNQSIDGWDDGSTGFITSFIRKRFADDIERGLVTSDLDSTIADNWTKDYDTVTCDSVLYHKYYEYEFKMDNLLASVSWFFAVTAFDFGDFTNNFGSLESSPLANSVEVWAINDATAVRERDLKVSVHPNPYIGDGSYAAARYEDPERTGFADHQRTIHFTNLPHRCTIKIYTLSGDLVRELEHTGGACDTEARITWNMRSANNELVASGIYLYAVISDWGSQVGKIVIIL